MSQKKDLKVAAKAVWQRVKIIRSERGKLYDAGDLTASADALAHEAAELKSLARQVSALSAMPSKPAKPTPPPAKKKKRRAK